jgi:ferrochelatase
MTHFFNEPAYTHGQGSQVGVLLLNLGTPTAPTAKALRPYLRQFLSDRRVVEIPRFLWIPLLYGLIVPFRSPKSALKYAKIWRAEGSPLLHYSEQQQLKLQEALRHQGYSHIHVALGMRYGQPSIEQAILQLKQQGCNRIVVLPLYPQYAASATGSALDAVYSTLQRLRYQPAVRVITSFHDHPAYIAALAKRVQQHWQTQGRAEKIIFSFHGVPQYTWEKGDPYPCFCHKTARLLAEKLQLNTADYQVAFQSRFGKAAWVQPYFTPSLQQLALDGVASVEVFCPGFVADCLETLEEIAIEGKQDFLAAGGQLYTHIPCLNDSTEWIHSLSTLVLSEMHTWQQADKANNSAVLAQTMQSTIPS